ncbi:conserved hypothetical protein [Aspergillus terreus NIH2624]|uniref:MIZ zinc finger protein n=1 Tax=Aspergillus terreus (strain NIH 2624 / FGSC A1156) TaxID=341663 RepID=Q0CKY3_ASPTN|nr:uncharacterized protein ATEG_05651 [Aspergillus terreus NIH2624]EAU33412.1 conserved hypothetical protein [Aspergillus terreus NIH2624]
MASSINQSELHSVVALVKTLTNAQLKDILRHEGLAVSGLKAALQLRIIDFIERLSQGGQIERFDNLRKFIYAVANRLPPSPSSTTLSPSIPSPQYPTPSASHPMHQHRPSPLGVPLSSPGFTPMREQTRDSVELKVILDTDTATRMQTDPHLLVMVYCAADNGLNQFTNSDVAFPHQVELKVNLDEVKTNLRGLKNKPGTTRPADITKYIRKKPGYPNHIVLTYALTQKRFFVLANLVRQHPVRELVNELKQRKVISKEQVIREMKSKADDSDIVTTSSVMSLKCPISACRIEVPCRSVVCTHNRCFDASSFLQLQEQAPTWTCPVCSKSTSYASLQVDQYVDDILRSTPSDVEQVIIEPDGRWSTVKTDDDGGGAGGATPASEDDDLVEIQEPGATPIKQESFSTPSLMVQRTPAQSREPSTTSSAAYMSTNKRPASQVIDLTGSDEDDDDDDLPVRPAKRPALNAMNRPVHRPEFRTTYGTGGLSNGSSMPYMGQNGSDSPSLNGGYDA